MKPKTKKRCSAGSCVWMPLIPLLVLLALAVPTAAQSTPPLHFVPLPSPTTPTRGGSVVGTTTVVPGPQGPKGDKGDPGTPGLPGTPGVSASGIVGVNALAPPTGLTAAVGDGIHDDTAALQAQVVYSRTNAALPQILSPGMYRLTTPLIVGAQPIPTPGVEPTDIEQGWVIQGQSPSVFSAPQFGGSCLYQGGLAQPAVLQLGLGGPRQSQISNVRIAGYAPNVTPASSTVYGIWNNANTHWSGLTLRNVVMDDVDTDICIDAPSDGSYIQGRNGEGLNIYESHLKGRKGLYINRSPFGQSLPESWYSVQAEITVPGGTALTFGGTGAGQQQGNNFAWYGISNTFAHESTVDASSLANTMIQTYGSEMVNLIGGRVEGCSTVVSWQIEGAVNTGLINVEGVKFDGMNPYKPFLKSVGGHEQMMINLTNDLYSSVAHAPFLLSIDTNSGSIVNIANSIFDGWSDYSALTSNPHIRLTNCLARTNSGDTFTALVHN